MFKLIWFIKKLYSLLIYKRRSGLRLIYVIIFFFFAFLQALAYWNFNAICACHACFNKHVKSADMKQKKNNGNLYAKNIWVYFKWKRQREKNVVKKLLATAKMCGMLNYIFVCVNKVFNVHKRIPVYVCVRVLCLRNS